MSFGKVHLTAYINKSFNSFPILIFELHREDHVTQHLLDVGRRGLHLAVRLRAHTTVLSADLRQSLGGG